MNYQPTPIERGAAIVVGGLILAAATDATIEATGGYHGPHAKLVIALACGVFVGAYVIGRAWSMSRVLACALIAALGAGELYNLGQTAERIISGREEAQAAPRRALEAHEAAKARLAEVREAPVSSARLSLAIDAEAAAKAEVAKEAAAIRCGKECERKQGIADKASAEVKAAVAEAETMKERAINAARADLAAHPLPASGTAVSDRTGLPAWAIDLGFAALLSIGANGLAGVLIAFGAHGKPGIVANENDFRAIDVSNDGKQSDLPPTISANDFQTVKEMILGDLPDPQPPKPRKRKRPDQLPENVIDFQNHPVAKALKAAGGSVSSNQELARLMSVSPGEASKRWPEIEEHLTVTREGKNLRIALRA